MVLNYKLSSYCCPNVVTIQYTTQGVGVGVAAPVVDAGAVYGGYGGVVGGYGGVVDGGFVGGIY